MLIFKHMCVASDNRTIVAAVLLFVENEYEIGIPAITLTVQLYIAEKQYKDDASILNK